MKAAIFKSQGKKGLGPLKLGHQIERTKVCNIWKKNPLKLSLSGHDPSLLNMRWWEAALFKPRILSLLKVGITQGSFETAIKENDISWWNEC